MERRSKSCPFDEDNQSAPSDEEISNGDHRHRKPTMGLVGLHGSVFNSVEPETRETEESPPATSSQPVESFEIIPQQTPQSMQSTALLTPPRPFSKPGSHFHFTSPPWNMIRHQPLKSPLLPSGESTNDSSNGGWKDKSLFDHDEDSETVEEDGGDHGTPPNVVCKPMQSKSPQRTTVPLEPPSIEGFSLPQGLCFLPDFFLPHPVSTTSHGDNRQPGRRFDNFQDHRQSNAEIIGPPNLRIYKARLPSNLTHVLDELIERAESHAASLPSGWKTNLFSLTRRDIAVKDIQGGAKLCQPVVDIVCQSIQSLYGAQRVLLDQNQPHILKYSARDIQKGVALHQDYCSGITANLMVSNSRDFRGGGTGV